MEIKLKRKYAKELDGPILELKEMIQSIKDKYDKKIEEYSYDPKFIGHLQILYWAEIKPYQQQIQYLIEQSQIEKIEVNIPKIDVDSEMAKQMKSIEEIILNIYGYTL